MLDLKNLEKSIQQQINALDETTTQKEILILVKALEVVTGAITLNDVTDEGKKQVSNLSNEGRKQVSYFRLEMQKISTEIISKVQNKLNELEAQKHNLRAMIKREIEISQLTK